MPSRSPYPDVVGGVAATFRCADMMMSFHSFTAWLGLARSVMASLNTPPNTSRAALAPG
jgi:hypothetical protein